MEFENIFFSIVCGLCSLIFGVIALWAFKSKDPVHFWSGSTVKPEEIADISSYNRANGFMWAIYAAFMAVAGIVSLFSITTGAVLLGIICVPGIVILIVVYNRIYNRYKNVSFTYKTDDTTPKTTKAVILAMTSISIIVFIAVGTMFFYGEKDPDIRILDGCIQIKTMYGLNIGFSEITDISLIEKSMRDIGIGKRTNGYGGVGKTLKGNFKSDAHGKTLLFVYSKSSPTIKIKRTDMKDIYISFHNSENTDQLYRELKATIPLK